MVTNDERVEKYDALQGKISRLLDAIESEACIKFHGFETMDEDSQLAVLDDLWRITKHLEDCKCALELKLY